MVLERWCIKKKRLPGDSASLLLVQCKKNKKCVGDGACTVLIILKKINKPIIQTN